MFLFTHEESGGVAEITLYGSVHKELSEDTTVILTANCPPKFTEARGPLEVIFS